MIIFWMQLFSDGNELYEETITNPLKNTSDTVPYIPSAIDKAINSLLGTLFMIIWGVSATLNPLLFWYHRTTKTQASKLFKYLAMADFLTNFWSPLGYSYFMLHPDLFPASHVVLRYACIWACLVGCPSQVISFLLAVSRATKIVLPFRYFKQRYFTIYLCGYIVFMTVSDGIIFVNREFFYDQELGKKMLNIGLNLCFWSHFAHCSAGLLVSVFSVIYLYSLARLEFDDLSNKKKNGVLSSTNSSPILFFIRFFNLCRRIFNRAYFQKEAR